MRFIDEIDRFAKTGTNIRRERERKEGVFSLCSVVQPGAYVVHRPEHWVYEGTGMTTGASFGAEHTVVGYECDGCEFELDEDGLPVPTHSDGTPETFTILAVGGPAIWAPGDAWWCTRTTP